MSQPLTEPSSHSSVSVESLRILSEMSAADWGADVGAVARDLFVRPHHGLMRTPWDALFACRNEDVRALAAQPDLGNQPAAIQPEPFAHGTKPESTIGSANSEVTRAQSHPLGTKEHTLPANGTEHCWWNVTFVEVHRIIT